MGLNYRKHRRLGPLPIWRNVSRSESGKTVSYSVKLGPFTWNSRTKKKTVDLPGRLLLHERVRGPYSHATPSPSRSSFAL